MSEASEPTRYLKPRTLFMAALGAVFLVELLVMFLLSFLPGLSVVGKAFLDSCLLSILVLPFLYQFFFKPLHRNILAREKTEIEREKIKELNRLKNEFISLASHELHTPLTSILGYSELLLARNHFDDSRSQEFASIINQKAVTMERLIDDLLDLSRVESGQPLRIQKEKCDIVSTIMSIVKCYREKHPLRLFNVNLPPTPIFFLFDKVRVEQVLENILTNATKFSPAESPVEIEGALKNGDFLIMIRDHGIGMSQEELCRVFEKFFRADLSETATKGLGLGMSVVKEIVAIHGGEIWLDSVPGKGTTVNLTLPVFER